MIKVEENITPFRMQINKNDNAITFYMPSDVDVSNIEKQEDAAQLLKILIKTLMYHLPKAQLIIFVEELVEENTPEILTN